MQPVAYRRRDTHHSYMVRPCFLIIDQEYSGNISTRKLVIETAKFNVITAYSGEEALETLTKFPFVDGIVLDPGVRDLPCSLLVKRIKESHPRLAIILAGTLGKDHCDGADYYLETFDPNKLLRVLQELEPEKTAQILRNDQKLIEPRS
jgi:DNA-binding response OmpR family regulator